MKTREQIEGKRRELEVAKNQLAGRLLRLHQQANDTNQPLDKIMTEYLESSINRYLLQLDLLDWLLEESM